MVKKHGDEMQKEGNETLPLPITLIRNFLVKKKHASRKVSIYYIGNCNVKSDKNRSKLTIENISHKSFGLVCWLNTKIFGLENSLFSNALKACVNGIDNSQEKDKKIWRGIEKDNLENSVLV